MNFLLHFVFADREEGRVDDAPPNVVGLGAMLPDLWRMADRALRTHASRAEAHVADPDRAPALNALLLGVDHHLRADAWFHRSEVFREGERALSRALLPLDTPKLVLFAHPTWEMCLDGALVTNLGRETIASALSVALDSAATHLDAALALSVSEEARALADKERYQRRMAWFVRAAADASLFLDYQTSDGLARRVAGMRTAFGLPTPSSSDLARWTEALEPFVTRATDALPKLFDERRTILERASTDAVQPR